MVSSCSDTLKTWFWNQFSQSSLQRVYILYQGIILGHMLSYAVLFLYTHTYTCMCDRDLEKSGFSNDVYSTVQLECKLVKRIHKLYILDIPSNVWLQYSVKYCHVLYNGYWDHVSKKKVQINSTAIISKTAFFTINKGVFHLYSRCLIWKWYLQTLYSLK
jgi:hypothetical protein